jgi:hypothetical protein
MPSTTAVTDESLLGLAALNGTYHVSHRLSEALWFCFCCAKDEIVSCTVAHLDFSSSKRSTAKAGKFAGKFTNGYLHD